jgi:AraC-like DNA-binding protein
MELQSTYIAQNNQDLQAYDYYLKGRYEQLKWTTDALDHAIHWYERSLEIDPKYARALYGLVYCHIYKVFWSSESKDTSHVYEYLTKAQAVDRKSADYLLAQASVEIMIEWDYQTGIEHFSALLQERPNNPEVLEALSGLYIMVGEFDEALIHIDRALEYNPLSLNHTFMKGNILYFSGRYAEAIKYMDKVLRQDPRWMFAVQLKAAVYILTHQHEALDDLLDQYKEYPFMQHYGTLHALYHGRRLDTYPLPFLAHETIHAWQLYFHTLEGEYDKAIALLKAGLDSKHGKYTCFNYDPFLANLREQPTYASLKEYISAPFPKLSVLYEDEQKQKMLIRDHNERKALLTALDGFMETEKQYLDSELSLVKLAERLQTSPNKLSWLINDAKKGNFNDYVNSYRLTHFKTLAQQNENKQFTLLGLALESGFRSKSTFNDVFKKKEGMSPRSWLKTMQSSN